MRVHIDGRNGHWNVVRGLRCASLLGRHEGTGLVIRRMLLMMVLMVLLLVMILMLSLLRMLLHLLLHLLLLMVMIMLLSV